MNRVAGMTINGNSAALAILRRSHGKWGTERAEMFNLDSLLRGPWMPGCPVILDAAAFWENAERRHTGTTLTAADMFLAAGWDVRPPRREGGRAVNPGHADQIVAAAKVGLLPSAREAPSAVADAMLLAAWCAAAPTSAPPPRCADPDGPCIGPPCMVESSHQFAECRVNMPALRSEDQPPPDDLAGLAADQGRCVASDARRGAVT